MFHSLITHLIIYLTMYLFNFVTFNAPVAALHDKKNLKEHSVIKVTFFLVEPNIHTSSEMMCNEVVGIEKKRIPSHCSC